MRRISSILTIGALALTGSAFAGDTIWGIDNGSDTIGTFDSGNPGVFSGIGTTGITSGFVNSLEFDGNGNLWASNGVSLYSIDRGTGSATLVGGHGITNGDTITDFAYDKSSGTMFAIGTLCAISSRIYTIDLNTGAATFVCDTDVAGACDVGLAFDGVGNLFGHDLVGDTIYSLDLGTCASTTVVVLPFNSNFGQGLTSNDNGLAYHVAFNSDAFQGELYSFNAGGNYTFLGVLQPLQIAGADVEVAAQACLGLDVSNLVGGETASFHVTGGNPGVRGVVVWGLGGQSSVFEDVNGWCASFGFDVKLRGRKVRIVNSGVFDGNGEFTVNRDILTRYSGLDMLFQAAERETCPGECMSDVVAETVG